MPIYLRSNADLAAYTHRISPPGGREEYVTGPKVDAEAISHYKFVGTYAIPTEGLEKICLICRGILAALWTVCCYPLSAETRAHLQGKKIEPVYVHGTPPSIAYQIQQAQQVPHLQGQIAEMQLSASCMLNGQPCADISALLVEKLRNPQDTADACISFTTPDTPYTEISLHISYNRFKKTFMAALIATTTQHDAGFQYQVRNKRTQDTFTLQHRPMVKDGYTCYSVTGINALGQLKTMGVEERDVPYVQKSSNNNVFSLSSQKTQTVTDYDAAWVLENQTCFEVSFSERYGIAPLTVQIDHPAFTR